MPWHPGPRLPALPGPGRLLPRAQAAPISIPTTRPGPPDVARRLTGQVRPDIIRAIPRR